MINHTVNIYIYIYIYIYTQSECIPFFAVLATFQRDTGPLVELVVVVHHLTALLVSLFWRDWCIPVSEMHMHDSAQLASCNIDFHAKLQAMKASQYNI